MRSVLVILFCWACWICSCRSGDSSQPAVDSDSKGLISDPIVQDSFFNVINQVTSKALDNIKSTDSLECLFLPVTASCPACRKKTIDSIVKYKDRLDSRHFVIITGSGLRTISGYFSQQEYKLPVASQIYYDTTGRSKILTSTNPNVYFVAGRKIYRKLSCTPATIKKDLSNFFAGL